MTAQQFKKEIIKFFEQKMSIAEAKAKIIASMKKDEYDNYITCSNVRIFFNTNKNFAEGGCGWYITNGKSTVKL